VIVTVLNQRGGSGKTTVVESLAVAWMLAGKRVLVINTDTLKTVDRWAARGVVTGATHLPTVINILEWRLLARQARDVASGYDRVLIDTPANSTEVPLAALGVCDLALVPVRPGGSDLDCVEASYALIEMASASINPSLTTRVLLNGVTMSTRIGRDHRGAMEEFSRLPLLRTQLDAKTVYVEAQTAGETPLTYGRNTAAKNQLLNLAQEIDEILEQRDGYSNTTDRPEDDRCRDADRAAAGDPGQRSVA